MLHRMRGLGIAGGRSIAAWVGAVCLGFALFGLVIGAAYAQTITEFSAGITAGAVPCRHHGRPRWQPVVHGI